MAEQLPVPVHSDGRISRGVTLCLGSETRHAAIRPGNLDDRFQVHEASLTVLDLARQRLDPLRQRRDTLAQSGQPREPVSTHSGSSLPARCEGSATHGMYLCEAPALPK